MGSMFEAFFEVLDIEFTFLGVNFTLLDVFYAGCILSLIGLALGKIFFFALNRR